jgi:hypothetical protein
MELNSTVFDNITFDYVNTQQNRVYCKVGKSESVWFTPKGSVNLLPDAKCVIFPKGKTTWEGFVPFVKGDIIYTDGFVAILHSITESGTLWYYCYYSISEDRCKIKTDFGIGNVKDDVLRLATEEEKQKLFDAIKTNGYRWNAETKTLENLIEPKFKVGDKIEKCGYRFTVVEIKDNYYLTKCGNKIPIDNQDDFSLVPNKFDITTLKPFESKVLVRDYDNQIWIPTFWGKRLEDDSNCRYLTTNGCYKYCIPYEQNQHLLGTTNDCDNLYKTWK